jgi:DNA-binding response OmpR family regulator
MDRPLKGRLVLVLEEEAIIAFDIADALHEAGAEPILASSLHDAFSLIESLSFSAAVLDYTMRHETCAALCERLSALGIPFVLTTGMDGQYLTVPHLRKPVNTGGLIKTLEELIERSVALD